MDRCRYDWTARQYKKVVDPFPDDLRALCAKLASAVDYSLNVSGSGLVTAAAESLCATPPG